VQSMKMPIRHCVDEATWVKTIYKLIFYRLQCLQLAYN